ncbi:MAG: selenocysteine-specific translation elongation factor [Acidimicrobiales bacterium]
MTVIATAGHVDHGKSALVHALCGTDPDRLPEEKRRGMTIDLGFAHRVTDDGTVLSFVDVPGHSDFVHTMVAGVSGVGAALLVVDAGEGWMPQTEEHLGILEVLGVTTGVVVLSRCDRVDAPSVDERTRQVSARLSSSPVRWTSPVRTSARTGEGIKGLVEALASVARDAVPHRDPLGRPRLFCDRVFTVAGAGTVVTGTLEGADVRRGDVLTVHRTGEEVRVRDVQTHGAGVDAGVPGTRCALNLSGRGADALRRGDVLVRGGQWWSTTVIDADVRVLDSARTLSRRNGYALHIGTSEQSASVRLIGQEANARIPAGESGRIRIRFVVPLPLSPGDRFLLRDPGSATTVGGGTVLDVDPQERISRAAPDGTVESQLSRRGWVEIDTARRLTGRALDPVVGDAFAVPRVVDDTIATLRGRMAEGSLDATVLAPHERLLAVERLGAAEHHGTVAAASAADEMESHPVARAVREDGLTPAPRTERDAVRRLVQRGILLEHDGTAFHRDVLDGLAGVLASLWHTNPEGFTVSQLRAELGITRKHAVPLAACLDRRGWTRRSGDLRLPGPLVRAQG